MPMTPTKQHGNDMTGIAYRPAAAEDAADIHALLLALAPEIPLLVDTLEREEALYALIRNCGRSGESWVALDERERIIGFVLVDPELLERHYAEYEILDLRYAGVAPGYRGHGIFGALIARVLARMVPVTATVPPQNRSNMAARLTGFGFHQTPSPGSERHFRWEPG
jgi:GNAT superfamily N-acetyltransferase